MERIPATDESYSRTKRTTSASMSIGRGRAYTYTAPHPPLKITITPMYDVCEQCGHRIRRRNLRTAGG
jgi:rRNA maturation endonuclease Nob1